MLRLRQDVCLGNRQEDLPHPCDVSFPTRLCRLRIPCEKDSRGETHDRLTKRDSTRRAGRSLAAGRFFRGFAKRLVVTDLRQSPNDLRRMTPKGLPFCIASASAISYNRVVRSVRRGRWLRRPRGQGQPEFVVLMYFVGSF